MSDGFSGLRVLLVGPVPPPHGGMANQTLQLADLLRGEGASVELVETNPAYRPAWIGSIPVIRAGFRSVPYAFRLARASKRADVVHVMASSGMSWHVFAAPAVWIAGRRAPVIVNYRGGGAAEFFRGSMGQIRPTLERAAAIVVPSAFLERVFGDHGFAATVVPNIINLERFAPAAARADERSAPIAAPHFVAARNLEPVYDIGTALRAFRLVRGEFPGARLSVAGSGPERERLESLARQLDLGDSVAFTGRLENRDMADLYRRADLVLNPSLVDNMPISILEALASGVPVVSTDVGGIPDLVRSGETAELVPPGDPEAMARAAVGLLRDSGRRAAQVRAGLEHVRGFAWERVRGRLLSVYRSALSDRAGGR